MDIVNVYMTVKKSIRGFLLKIGFVIAIALSFNPVDTLAEPVIISLPVIEDTELLITEVVKEEHFAESFKVDYTLPKQDEFDFHKNTFTFIFRLIHYERIVILKLHYQSYIWIDKLFLPHKCLQLKYLPTLDEEAIV